MGILVLLFTLNLRAEQLQSETVAAFDKYVELSEQRMKTEEQSGSFLHIDVDEFAVTELQVAVGRSSERSSEHSKARLRQGGVIVSRVQTLNQGRPIPVPGGLIHHWRGTAFVPGVTLTQTLTFLQDYANQNKFYAPDVERSRLLMRDGQHFEVSLRLRKKIAVLDTEYDIRYRMLNGDRALARSVSTRIAEIDNAGQKDETAKPVGDDNGFLWRLNSYWRFAQRDGGTYIELEAISLTRDIPVGLGWLIGPLITTIPKESLEFTLNRTREALLSQKK